MKKTILHLCADTGTDSWPYREDEQYEVITIGAAYGVENYKVERPIHGIFANPVCTHFSNLRRGNGIIPSNPEDGLWMVEECLRIVKEANPNWWVLENPATGKLKNYIGDPVFSYEPWYFGSPWTKRTALWGNFNIPKRKYERWCDVPKLSLYSRPGREKPSLAFLHKSSYWDIPEFHCLPEPLSDSEFRSYCSQKFARAFKEVNP